VAAAASAALPPAARISAPAFEASSWSAATASRVNAAACSGPGGGEAGTEGGEAGTEGGEAGTEGGEAGTEGGEAGTVVGYPLIRPAIKNAETHDKTTENRCFMARTLPPKRLGCYRRASCVSCS